MPFQSKVMAALAAVCVFCGAASGVSPAYAAAAGALGRRLAEQGTTLVYGGGRVGLMGTVADAALAAGGRVVGVIPRALMDREVGHTGLTELHVLASMHERKALMYDRSDAFVALPGGFGTLDELCETLTWGQMGLHAKPCGLLNVNGYWDPLLALFDHAVAEGFVRGAHRALVQVADDPARLLSALATVSVDGEGWVGRADGSRPP
jgi:uncharacterized protein (TIGR00730 family)